MLSHSMYSHSICTTVTYTLLHSHTIIMDSQNISTLINITNACESTYVMIIIYACQRSYVITIIIYMHIHAIN